MSILERLPNIYNMCNIYNSCTQYWRYYLHSSIAQQYCTSYCISLCAIRFNFIAQVLIWLNLLHILYILGNLSNYYTLLHTIVHNKVDQHCYCLLFSPPASFLLACDCCTVHKLLTAYCPCCSALITNSNQESHGFTVHRRPLRARARDQLPRCRTQIPGAWLCTLDLRRSPVIPCGC